MRELKFRAVISSNTIIHFTLSDLLDDKFSNRQLLHPWIKAGNTPDEFTGLRDKHGVDIYGNDIIKTPDGKVGTIDYIINEEDAVSGWVLHCDGLDFLIVNASSWEILGGVYQHPDLPEPESPDPKHLKEADEMVGYTGEDNG